MKNKSLCPACATVGQRVDNATIKSIIAVSLHRVSDLVHYFCATSSCDVVYFALDHSEVFYQAELREQVYQKMPDADDVLICYCFLHTVADVKSSGDEVETDIRYGIDAGHCACDWRNPQGSCCLGNVIKLRKRNNNPPPTDA